MTQDLDHSAARAFILQAYNFYDRLMQGVPVSNLEVPDSRSLGGRLFWVGQLEETGRALVVAGNVAGAASLAATSNAEAQRQAVRDGVVDFLVNSLDEALRILKNEIRKGQTVAVCVASPWEAVEREMLERGVQPDIFREGILRAVERSSAQSETGKADSNLTRVEALVRWSVDRAPALGLPKLDAIALECLEPEEGIARRWLQRSSRYLGRLGQAEHMVWATREFAARMIERTRAMTESREIAVGGRLEVTFSGMTDLLLFAPPEE